MCPRWIVVLALGSAAAAQTQFARLDRQHLPVPDVATAGVAADIDRDGDLDLIVVRVGRNTLLRNSGWARFEDVTTSQWPSPADNSRAVAVADLDGDGDLDVLVGNEGANRMYRNDGMGTFVDVSGRLPANNDDTQSIAVGDVDGDGDPDVVFGNEAPMSLGQQNRLYLGDGAGGFVDATATHLPQVQDATHDLVLFDADGDNDLDLALAERNWLFGGQNALYVNDGSGRFVDETATRLPAATDSTRSVAAGDVDGDGDVDLMFANQTVGASQNTLYLNGGGGKFIDGSAQLPQVSDATRDVVLADVDGDGDPDAFWANDSSSSNRLDLNNGSGVFTPAPVGWPDDLDNTACLAVADLDGNGAVDVWFGNYEDRNRLYLRDLAGAFVDAASPHLMAAGRQSTSAVFGDLDGDLDVDLVVGGDRNGVYLGDGRGRFVEATGRLPLGGSSAVALCDVDGDNDLDIVCARLGQNGLYLNDGGGVFADVTATHLPALLGTSAAVAAGDVDGDGDPDLVFGNRAFLGSSQTRLYRNDGTGRFRDVTVSTMPVDAKPTSSLALADVDRDGDLDLVMGRDTAGPEAQNDLYLNDGRGVFANVTATHLPVATDVTTSLAFGDVDRDGDLDLLVGNNAGLASLRGTRLYDNDGAGVFVDVTAQRLPHRDDATLAVALTDIDCDGDLDALLANVSQPSLVYVNDGTGVFADATSPRLPVIVLPSPRLAVADVDDDGDPDVLFASTSADELLLNLHRQVATPWWGAVGGPHAIDFYSAPGYAGSAMVVGAVSTGAARLEVPPVGVLLLDPATMIVLPAMVIPAPLGHMRFPWLMPPDPALLSMPFYLQAVIVEPAAAHLTNADANVVFH